MGGEDLANARLAPAPLEPVPVERVDTGWLESVGDRLAARAWADGLDTWFWGEAVCLLGLLRLAAARGRAVPPEVVSWFEEKTAQAVPLEHVNHLAPGAALALVLPERPSLAPALLELTDWFDSAAGAMRDERGTLEHWPGGVWADTVFMAGTFLGHAAAATGDLSRLQEFSRQVVLHADVLQGDDGLYVHGSHRGEVVRCRWGRANAWCALASVELLEIAAGVDPDTLDSLGLTAQLAHVRAVLVRQLQALASTQPEHGVWSVLVDDHPEVAGLVETSAAAGIGAAMLRATRLLPELPDEVRRAGWLAVRGALAYVDDDGALTRTSAGTVLQLVPFGYGVIRDDRVQPWGQGLALHAVAAALQALRDGEEAR